MPKKAILLLTIFVLIIIICLICYKYSDQICFECVFQREEFEQKINGDKKEKDHNEDEDNDNLYRDSEQNHSFGYNNSMMIANLPPSTKSKIDRIYPQTKYPYKNDYFYDQKWYPNLKLPFQVIGGGYRMTPLLGGTQIPIMNPPRPIDISDTNIAPNNITIVAPNNEKQQIGTLYKIFGNNNEIYPLFRSPARRNINQFNYYTLQGPYGVQVPVVTKNKIDELNTNDVVFLKGLPGAYRVTVYNDDLPTYVSTAF